MRSSKIRFASLVALAAAAVPAFSQFNLILNPNGALAANAPALAAFQRAADHWRNAFTDPITVSIDAQFANLGGGGIIGGTSSTFLQGTYTTLRNGLVTDAADEPSNAIVASLPTVFNGTSGNRTFSGNTLVTRANAKALGLIASDLVNDATMQFNTQFSFDFDRSNGITAGTIDFETVAEHELGHALGFVSGVDQVTASSFTPTTLDLFRFGTAPTTAAQFTNNARQLNPGSSAFFGDTANSYEFERGTTYQASHWRADELMGGPATRIGIMDPSIDFGEAYDYTAADLRAFDLIGWDIKPVPEPGTFAALALGGLAVLRRRKKA